MKKHTGCLVSFGGLPGTGKSTLAMRLAETTGAVYLRVDEIDAAIWRLDPDRDIGPESYHIAAALAASNLSLGRDAIVDCVNPWPLTRAIFAEAATRAGAALLRVETFCSDPVLHRRRVEMRESDIPGLAVPDWSKVETRDYRPWLDADIRIDTATLTEADAVAAIAIGMGVTGDR